MDETAKCMPMRKARGDFENFLHGSGIDIGAGSDPLTVEQGEVRQWDRQDGDAQLMAGVADNAFDFVYSSHCLEHMRDVPESLQNWTRILKPGGFLYLVVPDYVLYEKMTWPSQFNPDHKQSFSFLITRQRVGRANHWHVQEDMFPLIAQLGLEMVRFALEDNGFNYNAGLYDQTAAASLAQQCYIAKRK